MNKPALLQELEQLTSRERLELAYGLLDSVLHDATAWAASWREARAHLAEDTPPVFNRWQAGIGVCA